MATVPYPFLGGMFNTLLLFDVQAYIWLLLGLVVVTVINEGLWRITFWNPMTPWLGLWYAYIRRTNAAFVFDLKLNWDLVSEGGAKLIFNKENYDLITGRFNRFRMWLFQSDFSVQVAKKLQGDWEEAPLVTIGTKPTDLIFDAYHWTDKDSREREMIARCVEAYNESGPDQIHSLVKFMDLALNKKITCPNLRLTIKIPWTRIDASYSTERQDAAWAGFLAQLAKDMIDKPRNDLNKLAIVLLIFSGFICVSMIVMKVFIFKVPPTP